MKEILKLIEPSKEEQESIKIITKEISKQIKIPNTKIILGGSSAKNTFLKNNHDIDIYVKFDPKNYHEKNISKILKKSLKKAIEVHGSRDYFQIKESKYIIEIIPIMDITNPDKAENITDISPFHTKFVLKNKKYRKDILLAKAFTKANGFYGAESYIQGFSGYSIEVLTIHYKGFNNLIKKVSQWESPTIIDTKNYHKGHVKLNDAKMVSPIILVDPVQASRNVTAVVSEGKYNLFIKRAKDYLKKPSKYFFIKEDFSLERIIQQNKDKLITIEIEPLEGKKDIVGSKLLKCFEYIKAQFQKNEFKLIDANWHWNEKAIFYFKFPQEELSKTIKHYGPPITNKQALDSFKKTWSKYPIKTENNKSYVIIPRKYTSPELLIKELINSSYCKERVKIIHHKLYKR